MVNILVYISLYVLYTHRCYVQHMFYINTFFIKVRAY